MVQGLFLESFKLTSGSVKFQCTRMYSRNLAGYNENPLGSYKVAISKSQHVLKENIFVVY